MKCPKCNGDVKVIDVRKDDECVHRKRMCKKCFYIFYTGEYDISKEDYEMVKSRWCSRWDHSS